MSSPTSPPSTVMLEILKNCPRGRLTYERQSSYSPIKQEKTSVAQVLAEKSSDLIVEGNNDENVTTPLAGSLADVSSVLEDVTLEMCDLQVQRLASVIKKINDNRDKTLAKNENNLISEDGDSDSDLTYVWISPLIEEETKEEGSPKLTKLRPKMAKLQLSPRHDLNSIVSQELTQLEAERKLQVEAKVTERHSIQFLDFCLKSLHTYL